MYSDDINKPLGLRDLELRLERLGARVSEQMGEVIVEVAEDLADEVKGQIDDLLLELVDGARALGATVRQLGTRSLAVRLPGALDPEQEQPAKPAAALNSALLSRQLFDLAELWREIGLEVHVNEKGDLVFCRPVGQGGKVCATVEGSLIKRAFLLGRRFLEALIKRIVRTIKGGK